MSEQIWQISPRRSLSYKNKTLIMGVLNVTPDSFSDGGKFFSFDQALRQAEKLVAEGADILDVGGESTRPQSAQVGQAEEIRRVVPIITAIAQRFNTPVSIDTTKSQVAQAAVDAGADIINDISGLRFDENIAKIAAKTGTGLILMHSRGDFESIHRQEPVAEIVPEVIRGLNWSLQKAEACGVSQSQIALDVGIGFSKTFEQNLELLARLANICAEFKDYPMLIGTSRKSFIGKILNEPAAQNRLNGTLASVAIAVFNGANIVRVHDVQAAAEAAGVAQTINIYRDK